MDLLKIKVENFRCFQGFHELDVTEGPLWVVKGENGSGKSTLICDSILFALFNTIPSLEGTQSLKKQELINIKSRSMSVQIWFNHNGNKYSIRRSYRLRGRSDTLQHQFEFWENSKLIADLPRQDDARILVSKRFWDIEDFRNTTIILQKEITNSLDQRESERKKSIEKIFNIERFEKMSELAHQHAKDTTTTIKIINNSLDEIKKMIVDEQELQEKRFKAQESQKLTKISKDKLETELTKSKSIKESLEKVVQQGSNLKEKIAFKKKDLLSTEQEKETITTELQAIDSNLSKEKEFLETLTTIESIEKSLENSAKVVQDIANKEKERDNYQQFIAQKERAIQTDLKQIEKNKALLYTQLASTKTEIDAFKEKESLVPKLTELVQTLPSLKTSNDKLQKQLELADSSEKNIFLKQKDLEILKNKFKVTNEELHKKEVQMTNLQKDKSSCEEIINKNKVIGKKLELKIEDLEELQLKEQNLKNSLFKFDHEIDQYQKQITELNKENNEFKSLDTQSTCPKCKQKLDKHHISDIIHTNMNKTTELEKNIALTNENKNNLNITLQTLHKNILEKKKTNQELDKIKNVFVTEKTKLETILKQITALSNEIDQLTHILETEVTADKITTLEGVIKQLKEALPNISKLKEEKKSIEKNILEISKNESTLTELNKQLATKPEKVKLLDSLTQSIADLNAHIKIKNEQLTSKSYVKEEMLTLNNILKQIEDLRKQLPEIEVLKKKLQSLQPDQTRATLKLIDKQKIVKEEKLKRIISIDKILNTIKKDIQDFEAQLNQLELDKIIPDVDKYKLSISELESQISEVNIALAKLEFELQQITELMARNNQYISDYKQKTKEYEQLKNQKDDYDLLATLFKDIGKRILNRVMSRINLYSTEILSKLGNDQLEQINLIESRNGFELKIMSNGEERYPNWFSGGQKVRIGLAFRLSLSRTLAEVTGGDIETILIDEGDFGALDDFGLKGVAEILNELKMHFKRMVVVTHMDRLANELDGQRLLIKDSKIITEQRL